MSRISPWFQACRPLAQVNIAVPIAVGEAMAYAQTGRLDWTLVVVAHAFGVADHLLIVFANDLADEDGDAKNPNPTPFSGGSRVLVEGKLSRAALRGAAVVAAVALLALCGLAAVVYGRHGAWLAFAAATSLLWAYSFPPVAASYRGGGEILQGLGLGVVLVLWGHHMQVGTLGDFPWLALIPTFLLGWAGNVTTAIPDEEGDRLTNKRSYPVVRGAAAARWHALQVIAIAVLATPFVLPGAARMELALVEAPALAIVIYGAFRRRSSSDVAFVVTNGAAINTIMLVWIAALCLRPEWAHATSWL